MTKVFIGMPVYNGERFLGEAITSLLNQTYADWELFVSDDASTDGTRVICEEFAKKDPRITYHRQEKNIGMFPNFKFLLDKANCEYFMWAAQDDLWEKEFINTCIRNLEANKETGFSMTNITEIDSSGHAVRDLDSLHGFSSKKPRLKIVSRYILQPEILGKCNLMYSFFRTATIKTIWGIYPQRMTWGADYLFSLALISHFGGVIDKRLLFKKRYGGFSNPTPLDASAKKQIQNMNPKNKIFPFGRASQYLRGHIEALAGTPYRLIGVLLFLLRIPRSYLLWIKERLGRRVSSFKAQQIHKNKQRVLSFYSNAFGLKILVETGTYKGDMVEAMRNKFAKIFSIELGENLCKAAQNRFMGDSHIEVICGNSDQILPKLMDRISEPALFWLDAHYSRGETAKGNLDTPIIKELETILGHGGKNNVILIDDARLFDGTNDYPKINALKKYVLGINPNNTFEVSEDIIRIFHKK